MFACKDLYSFLIKFIIKNNNNNNNNNNNGIIYISKLEKKIEIEKKKVKLVSFQFSYHKEK